MLLGSTVWILPAFAQAQTTVSAATGPKASAAAATASGEAAPTAEQIRATVEALDDDSFRTRQFALTRLNGWAALPAAQASLAEVLRATLLDPNTSFEVRTVCEPLLVQLPNPEAKADAAADPGEIDRLIALCDADTFTVRAGAAVRLAWLARGDAKVALSISNKIKQQLADPELSSEKRTRLTEVWEAARGVWLASDSSGWPRPQVTDAQVEAWVNTLGAPGVDKAARIASDCAERELFDLMSHDDQVARVRAAIEKRLPNAAMAAEPEPANDNFEHLQAEFEAIDRVQRMYEWTKPAMVAEIWKQGRHDCTQYLEIGVKQYLQGAMNPRPTLFDQIDNQTARCVSGNSLAPGDYPVGIAIPPTSLASGIDKDGRMFHLINLSTPRLRLLYENYQLKRSEETRLAELTERSIAWMLAQKRTLTDREILMLTQLEPIAVSRFVGPYLAATEDATLVEPTKEPPGVDRPKDNTLDGFNSRHALLCMVLSEIGNHECLPGLTEGIRRGRIPGPSNRSMYHVGWLSALAIADRDPWPGLDDWLASLIDCDDPLHQAPVNPPDIGATAAAMLLIRHGASISEFGLIEYSDGQPTGMNIPLCRFNATERRAQVLQWWKQRRPKTPAA